MHKCRGLLISLVDERDKSLLHHILYKEKGTHACNDD